VNKSVVSSSPAGLTFQISLWLLGLVALVQVSAVIWKVVPAAVVRASSVDVTLAEAQDAPEPFRPDSAAAGPSADEVLSAADTQLALAIFEQAESAQRVGDWDTALEKLAEAMTILGETPELRFRRAFYFERLGREREALAELESLQLSPQVPEALRQQSAQLADRIRQILLNEQSVAQERGTPLTPGPAVQEEDMGVQAGPVLEEFGLQPGASLGIVDVREIDRAEDTKVLRIAIKSRPNTPIDASEVKVHVQFFEQTPSGELILTNAPVRTEWISPPVDWDANEPEILDVTYPVPGNPLRGEADVDEANNFHGYIVGIYHRDELQDNRSVPGPLEQQFPLELFLQN